jgi:hypothetical protein
VLPITHFESIVLGMAIGFGGIDNLLRRINPILVGIIGIVFFVLLCILPNLNIISNGLILNYSFVGIATSLVLFF